jgi:crossover junction endodeoxyribonuclease RuvC
MAMVSPKTPVRVLGIDPGSQVVGWAVVEQRGDGRYQACAFGALRAPKGAAAAKRLEELCGGLEKVLAEHAPMEAAIEEAFHGRDASAALRIGEARGALLLTLSRGGLVPVGYTNNVVKKAVTGGGRATKDRVQTMVQRILCLDAPPTPFDAADALAVAICHLQRRGHLGGDGELPPRLREALKRAGAKPGQLRRGR